MRSILLLRMGGKRNEREGEWCLMDNTADSKSSIPGSTPGSPAISELKELLAKATPGPWAHLGRGTVRAQDSSLVALITQEDYPHRTKDENEFIAALIVAAVNALPGLIARVEEYEEFIDELCLKPYDDSNPVSLFEWVTGRALTLKKKWRKHD